MRIHFIELIMFVSILSVSIYIASQIQQRIPSIGEIEVIELPDQNLTCVKRIGYRELECTPNINKN